MERRRDERISVSLKAALLNDRTLPRGCRVRDFSQRGMLLQYDYDGNDSGFDAGDTVAVRLSLRQTDERKVVTLPATVRRVEQNGIGVEFQQPEARLLELLEPWRLDRPQQQEADRTGVGHGDTAGTVTRLIRPRPRHRGSAGRAAPPVFGAAGRADRTPADVAAPTPAAGPVPKPAAPALTDRRLFYVGLVSLVSAMLILVLDFGDNAGLKHRLSALEAGSRNHAAALSEMRDRFAAVGEPGQALADLNARLDTLTVSVAALDGKLAAAAPRASFEAAAMENNLHPENDATASPEPAATPVPVPAATAAAARDVEAVLDRPAEAGSGPWLINLVSLYDQAAADRFVATADSKGVRVTQNRVTVKGREVWRLQISGFATQQEARAYGATVSEKLGLKDVWVFKR